MKRIAVFWIAMLVGALPAIGQQLSGKSNKVSVEYQAAADNSPTRPVLVWVSPDQKATALEVKKMVIKVGVKSTVKLKNVTIYVNGQLVADRGMSTTPADAAQFDKYIDREVDLIVGGNELKIVAENDKGEITIESRAISVTLPTLASGKRTDYALIIGTNDYDEWDDLTNPAFDAKTIATELEKNYNFKTELILNPSKTDIVAKIREYGKRAYLPMDQLFIFIAGHGQFDEVFTEGYVVAKNTKLNDETRESYLAHSQLRTYISNIPCDHIFLAMDVCYGGTFDQSIAKAGSRGADEMYNGVEDTEFIERKLRFKTRKYLTSGGKQYVPDGRPNEHSPFARKLLDAFRNYGGQDHILTLGEIITYVERATPEPKFGDFPGDEPGSDFVFVAKH